MPSTRRPGRPAHTELHKKWKVQIPATVAGAVEFLLLDPITSRPKHGARSHLVESLLRDWLARQGQVLEAQKD